MNNPVKIKVIGVGGSGCNAISRMEKCKIKGVELIAANSDYQDLKKVKADAKIQI
jgi:cell division protein FtsZ